MILKKLNPILDIGSDFFNILYMHTLELSYKCSVVNSVVYLVLVLSILYYIDIDRRLCSILYLLEVEIYQHCLF